MDKEDWIVIPAPNDRLILLPNDESQLADEQFIVVDKESIE